MTIDAVATLAPSGQEDAKSAAMQLEAYFLRRMLSEVRSEQTSGLFSGGVGGRVFREMLDDALADAMAEGGGLGFAQIVEAQLTGQVSAPELPRASRLRGAYRGVGVAQSAVAAYKAATGPLSVIPVHGRESSQFGPRTNPITGKANYHTGLDIAARTGTPARSSGDGVVIRARRSGGYGNMVIVDHGNGLTTRYAHLSEFKVKKGDQVQAGSVIGLVGSTGMSTGPHLHFEVRRDGKAVDPKSQGLFLKNPGNRSSR